MLKISLIILLLMALNMVNCAPLQDEQRNRTVGIDIGPFFRMGLINDKIGTKLDLEVLSGLVNVGVDHRKNGFQNPEDGDFADKPGKFRIGNTDVYVNVGRRKRR